MSELTRELSFKFHEFQTIIHDEVRFKQISRSRTSIKALSDYIDLLFKCAMSGHQMHDFPDYVPDDELNYQGEDVVFDRLTKLYRSIRPSSKRDKVADVIRKNLCFAHNNGDGICDGFSERIWDLVGSGDQK